VIAFVFTASLCVGYALLRLVWQERLMAACGGLILGTALWAWILFAMLLFGIAAPFTAAGIAFASLGAALIVASGFHKRFEAAELLVPLLSWLVALALFHLPVVATTSGDAGYMIMMGVDTCRFDTIPADIRRTLMYGYPPLIPMLQATACKFTSANQLVNFIPLFAIAQLLFLIALLQRIGYALIAAVLGCLIIFSSTSAMIHVVYFNHHLLLGFMILMFAVITQDRKPDQDKASVLALLILLFGIDIGRAEAALVSLILLVVLIRHDNFSVRERLTLALGNAVAVTLYLGFVASMEVDTSIRLIILNRFSIAVLIAITWAYAGYVALTHYSAQIARLDRSTLAITLCLSVVAMGLAVLVAPIRLTQSLAAIFTNTFLLVGFWGFTWWILVGALVIAWRLARARSAPLLSSDPRFVLIVSMLALMMLLAVGRDPYRLGFGDTFNRFLAHLAPVWLWLVADLWRRIDLDRPVSSLLSKSAGQIGHGTPSHAKPPASESV